ncbi:type IV secretory system conjugative DNA transfer family protein [Pseudomonas asuensis]|uniref:Lipoprotein n=1 Tax=Pseudomonas asuensis TaxID=1825787 RepID=A0ABQ2H2S2_9PSED|nr:type IV secretory system conjugative DNA transfer family protein [Pseudomonas asuensis]GGM25714.1 lipoprotein [Pseudomonas asuensis]
MKRFAVATLPFFVSGIVLAGEPPQLDAASTANAPKTWQEDDSVSLESLMHPESKVSSGITDLRTQMLNEAGTTVGFRGGMAARSRELVKALEKRNHALSMEYQFAPLISRSGTLPPVIVEAQDVAAFAPDQVRTANKVYKIHREERFVSVPPTWRDYLFTGMTFASTVDLPVMEARPQNSQEQKIWEKAVRAGWVEGEKQADDILDANFNRLVRDMTGMMLYSALLQNDLIKPTRIAESEQTVTGDGQQLMLGDKLRRLTEKASFETDPNKWRPTVHKPRKKIIPSADTNQPPIVGPQPSPSSTDSKK